MKQDTDAERFGITIGSKELGLQKGTLADLDAAVATLPRRQLADRTVSVLAALDADHQCLGRSVSLALCAALGDEGRVLNHALQARSDALFLEPMQQLIILRRCLAVGRDGDLDMASPGGLLRYFDACRFAADVAVMGLDDEADVPDGIDGVLAVAANLLLRFSLVNPPHPTNWIARLRLMLIDLPKRDKQAQESADRLRAGVETVFGFPFEDVLRVVQMLAIWSFRFTDVKKVFENPAAIAFDESTFLSKTTIDPKLLTAILDRTARSVDVALDDAELGGSVSILPFRDRPFLRFPGGLVAPVFPPLVIEKLTHEFFWWAAEPSRRQDRPWQEDWGNLVELYVVDLLAWIAGETGCHFKADIRWDKGQIDAVMWFKKHVALFEVSASMLLDAVAHGGDGDKLGKGLYQTLVRSTRGGRPKNEVIGQVVRDVKALLAGELDRVLPIGEPASVYPVAVTIDRSARTAPLRLWFDSVFNAEFADGVDRSRLGAPAVLSLEDIEAVEELVRRRNPKTRGTPPGLLRLLRTWTFNRDHLRGERKAGAWYQFVATEVGIPTNNARLKQESDRWLREVSGYFPEGSRA